MVQVRRGLFASDDVNGSLNITNISPSRSTNFMESPKRAFPSWKSLMQLLSQSNAPKPSKPSCLPFSYDSELNSIFLSLPTLIKVTLIAMANVRPTFVSLLHMFGAILLAFGTELNKQSLWVFLAPALTGICIISVSWGMKCRKKKQLYPSKKYLALYLPLGSVLVMIGLVSDT